MIYYSDTWCIEARKLIKSDRNKNGVISRNNYRKLSQIGKLDIKRNGCRGTTALVAVDGSMRPDIYDWVIENFGDPYAVEREQKAEDTMQKKTMGYRVVPDLKAATYFAAYTFPNGKHIPSELQIKYGNTASVLNAVALDHRATIEERLRSGNNTRGVLKLCFLKYLAYHDNLQVEWPHTTVGRNVQSFSRKLKAYADLGHVEIISARVHNQNRSALKEDAERWVLARFADPVDKYTIKRLFTEYNAKAPDMGWTIIKTEDTIRDFLFNPENRWKWLGTKHGELKVKEEFTRQERTILPTMRDSIWEGDGTKLNLWYLGTATDKDGKTVTKRMSQNVYEVIDVFSETLLGFYVSPSEDFEAQWHAFKHACEFAGHRPYEVKFDNQGGHKKLKSGNFFANMSKLAHTTKPYNGRSKVIESVFGRFQQEVIYKKWNFTGQNITTISEKSKANMEMILTNTKRLPSLAEVIETYKELRNEWNNAPHHRTGIPRIEMYRQSHNPKAASIEIWDMVNMFWVTTEKESTYRPSGIEITVKKQKYAYEVLTASGVPDVEFLRDHSGRKFHVKYDPDDMTIVQLWSKTANGLIYEATAQPYLTMHRGIQEQLPGERTDWAQRNIANNNARLDMREFAEELLESEGRHPKEHGLRLPAAKGIGKRIVETHGEESHGEETQRIAPVRKKRVPVLVDDIGEYQKELSNAEVETHHYDKY